MNHKVNVSKEFAVETALDILNQAGFDQVLIVASSEDCSTGTAVDSRGFPDGKDEPAFINFLTHAFLLDTGRLIRALPWLANRAFSSAGLDPVELMAEVTAALELENHHPMRLREMLTQLLEFSERYGLEDSDGRPLFKSIALAIKERKAKRSGELQ